MRLRIVVGVLAVALGAAALAYWLRVGGEGSDSVVLDAASDAEYQAGDWAIDMATVPPVPRVGENELIVRVYGAQGQPVEGLDVNAFAEMPAMGSMPAMRAPAGMKERAPGEYVGVMNLSMRGEWPLTVELVESDGSKRRLQFDFATGREDMPIVAGGVGSGSQSAADGGMDHSTMGHSTTKRSRSGDNAIAVDARRRQLIGLKTANATHHDLVKEIDAVGRVTFDERLVTDVSLKFDGFVGDLVADYVGVPVEKGQTLFTVYSPELLAAQEEYLEISRRRRSAGSDDALLSAARDRLRLWDMPEAEITALTQRGRPLEYVPILAPQSGTLVAREITAGGAAPMGQTLLKVADLSQVWVEADVYEADVESLSVGMPAVVTLPYVSDASYTAEVEYIYPYLESDSRTVRVRLTLDNPDGVLRPDTYATVSLQMDLGHRLAVPEEAVIVAGDDRIVFVDLGDGRLDPTRVETGERAEGYVIVEDGLTLGDRVVTSGNFLIAAEARLKSDLDQW